MTHILIHIFTVSFLLLTYHTYGQGDNTDTLKNISIDEVLVRKKQGIDHLRQQEQRASRQTGIDKILDHVSGVQMLRRGNYAMEPTIRSLNAGQINLTIDGMAIFGACTDRMDPISSYIEPTNLQQLNVNLSPSFDNYGGAIGGGINFKLAEATTGVRQKWSGMVGSGVESNANGLQTLASLQYSSSKFAFLANSIFRKADNYHAANRSEVLFSQYEKWNASISAKYNISEQHTLTVNYLMDDGQNIGYPALTMDVAFAKAKILGLTHQYEPASHNLQTVRTKLYFNYIDHAMDDSQRPAEQVPIPMDMPGQSWTAGYYTESSLHLPHHHIEMRASGYVNRLSANMTMYPVQGSPMFMYSIPDAQRSFISLDLADKLLTRDNWGLEVQSTWGYAHSSIYSASAREQLSGMTDGGGSRSNYLLNLGVTGSWQPSNDWQFHGRLGFANRSATLQEYYGFYLFNRLDSYDYIGQSQLATEKSWQTNIGFSYSHNWVRMEGAAFSYLFKDYIAGQVQPEYQAMTVGANGVKQYHNIPHAQLYGAELSIRVRPLSHLEWISTNTFTKGYDNELYALPMIAPYTSNNSLIYTIGSLAAQFEVEHNATQNHVSTARYGDSRTPASTILNIGTRKTFDIHKRQISATLRVENLMDKYYYRHLDMIKIARPGRNIIGQLSFIF